MAILRSLITSAKQFRSNLTEALGMCVISAGIALIYPPAGIVVAGLALCVIGYAIDKPGDDT